MAERQGNFVQEMENIQRLKGKLIKGLACDTPLDLSEPEKDCGPDEIIAIKKSGYGIIRQLAEAAQINYAKATDDTKRLLYELSLQVTKDSNDGIKTRPKDRISKHVSIANIVRKGDILGVQEKNFDRVMEKFRTGTEGAKAKDTGHTKFETEKQRVITILGKIQGNSEVQLGKDKFTIFGKPSDPEYARVIQDSKTFIFDEPSGTKGSRTRNIYQLNKEGDVIGGVQVEEGTNTVKPIQGSQPFKITFFPFKIDSK